MASTTRTCATIMKTLNFVPPWVSMPQNATAAPSGISAKAVRCHKFQVFLDLRGRRCPVVIGGSLDLWMPVFRDFRCGTRKPCWAVGGGNDCLPTRTDRGRAAIRLPLSFVLASRMNGCLLRWEVH